MKNNTLWKDDLGNDIQAHGGMILKHEDTYYWYGEHKGTNNVEGTTRVDIIGISCYSSKNLMDWHYEGLVLKASDDINDPLYYKNVCERAKVLYNKQTKQFVMWMHIDHSDYTYAACGVAVSNHPCGPFQLIKVMQPNRLDCRDMTLFQDVDGTAYLFHSCNWNKTMAISRLTSDFLDVDGFFTYALIDQSREAPALCIHNGKYYMITSGCTAWEANSALYAKSDFILGPWELIDNPCVGKNYRKTFYGQSTYIFEHNNQKYLMLDHWHPYDLQHSTYSFLPISFDDDGTMNVTWCDEFKIDAI